MLLKVGVCALLGCYITPVTSFQTSTTQTISVISAFYSSRNSYEAQLYLADIANDPSLPVATKDAAGRFKLTASPGNRLSVLDCFEG